ncbi:hypothetical protein K9M06_02800 [Candidatus Bipolaricaulota bacterium]|nr:hypothetical protein [Candidatus Bipolaricaulota bacterium]
MRFRKLTVIAVPSIIFILIFTLSITGRADYWSDVASVFHASSDGMNDLKNDANALSEGEISGSTVLANAKVFQDRSFNQLKMIVRLESQAPDITFHVRMVSIISDWHLTTLLWQQGVEEWDEEKLDAAAQVLYLITKRSRALSARIKKQSN